MRQLLFVAVCLLAYAITPAYADSAKVLDLSDALAIANANAPILQGAQATYDAAQGERIQADVFPNPALQFDAENIAGSGQFKGTDSAEFTAGFSQQIPIIGKRSARKKAADEGIKAARFNQSATQLDLKRDVTRAFTDAVAAQEEAIIAAQQVTLARDVYATVNKRVSAAAAPVVQRSKAKISLVNAELVAEKAKGQQNAALRILMTRLGTSDQTVKIQSKDFYVIAQPEKTGNANALLHTADYKQQSAQIEQAKSFLDLERVNTLPDPSINVGVRDFRAGNDQALVLGLSIPIPVFDRNSGNIQKARQQVVKAGTDRQKALLDKQADLATHEQQLQNAYITAKKIKASILPEANEAFKQAQHGYKAGKFQYLEVLDAQRTLTDTRLAYVQALKDYHINKAEVERLIAQDTSTGEDK